VNRYLSNSEPGGIRAQLSKQEKRFFAPFLICLGNDRVKKVASWRELAREQEAESGAQEGQSCFENLKMK
jgi:hypothetical protein